MRGDVPNGLAETPTGAGLCTLLEPVELGAAPDGGLGEVLAAEWRQLGYQQARVWAVMAEIASRDPWRACRGRRRGVRSRSSSPRSTRCGPSCVFRAARRGANWNGRLKWRRFRGCW